MAGHRITEIPNLWLVGTTFPVRKIGVVSLNPVRLFSLLKIMCYGVQLASPSLKVIIAFKWSL